MAAALARDNWRTAAVAAGAGVFLAAVSAFGMNTTSLTQRLLYWVPVMLAGAVVGRSIAAVTSRRPRAGANRFIDWALLSLLVSVPTTLLVWAVTGAVFHGAPTSLLFFFGAVLLISAPMTAIMMAVNTPGAETRPPAPGAPPHPVRFMARLPTKIMGGIVYAVQAEDHYLRVRTSKGDDLILMRLADAMTELDGVEGAQVHRSWWVAKDGVADVKRADGRVTLVLKDGAEAPVSRPNVKALREAGWLR